MKIKKKNFRKVSDEKVTVFHKVRLDKEENTVTLKPSIFFILSMLIVLPFELITGIITVIVQTFKRYVTELPNAEIKRISVTDEEKNILIGE